MSETIVSMDSAGRVILPKKIREQLHLPERAEFRLSVYGDSVELAPIEKFKVELEERDGILIVPAGNSPNEFDAVSALDELRNEPRRERSSR